jgi:YfiH family protein
VTNALSVAILSSRGIRHGFGVRGSPEPPGLLRPKQVHGIEVVAATECRSTPLPEADAVVSDGAAAPVGVITADCVPVLLATDSGAAVAAVHAGWRGLAKGVIEAGIDALRHQLAVTREPILAAIGPHIGACCYEVDEPVLEALEIRFPDELQASLAPSKTPGRAFLNLSRLVRAELVRLEIDPQWVDEIERGCTHCDALRFHSYRRDGLRAGRMVHFIHAREAREG